MHRIRQRIFWRDGRKLPNFTLTDRDIIGTDVHFCSIVGRNFGEPRRCLVGPLLNVVRA